jgi:hypothetical protein
MPTDYELAPTNEVGRRASMIDELLELVCGPDERPWFISDEASIMDVCSKSPDEIVCQLRLRYERSVAPEHLLLPLWRLVDMLHEPGSR